MGVLILAWVDFAYLARLVGVNALSLSELYLRLAWVATPLLFYFTYLTSIYVIKKQKSYRWISVFLLICALVLSFATAFSDLVIKSVTFVGIELDIVYGVAFYPFLFIISVFIITTLTPLLRGKINKDTKSFLFGVIIFYLANVVFNIILPVFFGITHLYYIGDYSTLLLLGFTAYAIIKHELFDIRIVVTEVLTVMIWTILLAKLFISQSITETIIDSITLILVIIFGILLVRSVIREIKQREKLQVLNKRLKDLDKQKDEFVSMAAHELRAPMTAVKGYLAMIMEGDTGDIPGKARGYLADANAINERLIRLVNNMLNVSRIEEGRQVYQLEPESLSQYVRTVYNQFTPEAKRKGLKYNLEIAPEVRDKVYVDGDRIQEVIANLISNAIKYTDQGSVTVKLVQPTAGSVKLEIKDTGPGISSDEQKKLFRKFYRVETNVGKTTGTGLGLYISKLLVGKFGGKIGLESEPGKGSNFWFELPLVASNYRVAKNE